MFTANLFSIHNTSSVCTTNGIVKTSLINNIIISSIFCLISDMDSDKVVDDEMLQDSIMLQKGCKEV